jgi:hypothetical protein
MDVRRLRPLLCLLAASAALATAGCSTERTLETKSAAVPAGIDLSGHWRLREGSPDAESPRRKDGSLVHVFLETGRTLKITQTEYGLFISFDRAVVEEYRFGENREVKVGEAAAQRASGWEGDHYLIETLDDDGALLTETYRLGDGGETLIRTITIVQHKHTRLDIRQSFDRY